MITILYGPNPIQGHFLFEDFVVSGFRSSSTDGVGGTVKSNPPATYIFGTTEESVREVGSCSLGINVRCCRLQG